MLDHQSTLDDLLPWRSHVYAGALWRRFVDAQPRRPHRIPFIYVDDLTGSVLNDPVADPGHLALVEIARTVLYAYNNPNAVMDPRLPTLGPLFDVVLDCFGPDEIKEILSYVAHALGKDSPIFAIIMNTLSKAVREVYMTIADQLRDEGRREGRATARAEALLCLLEHRAWPLSASLRNRVLATHDEQLLQYWFDRALTVDSLEEVFQVLDA